MPYLRSLAVIFGVVSAGAVLASPAWARGPSHANITFAVGSTVTPTATGVTAAAVLVWRQGASDVAGVGCCSNDVVDAFTDTKLVEGTPQNRFPFTWQSDDSEWFRIDSFDARGN